MAMWLRYATAGQEIMLGPFLDSTDGNTQETALVIVNTSIKLWKEGATSEVSKNSLGASHIANGRYYAVLDATDTDTLGKLEINVHVTGALAVRREYMVLPAVVFDALVLGTDNLDVSTVQLAGQTVTAGAGVTFPSSVASPTNITAGTIANLTNLPAIPANWLTATGIAANALNGKGDWLNTAGVAAAVWNAAVASYGTAGTYGALIELNLDAQVSTVGGGSLTAADVADAVWDELLSGHAIGGSAGAAMSGAGSAGDPWTATLSGYGAGTAGKLINDNINATISSRLATSGYTAPPSAATIADSVWDEALSGHTTGGSAGAGLSGATAPTAAAVADAVWDEALSGHLTAGSTGEALDGAGGGGGTADWTANQVAAISSILGVPASGTTPTDPTTGILDTIRDLGIAIKAKTDTLPADPADASDIAASFTTVNSKLDAIDNYVDTEIADIQSRLPAALVGGRMDANLGAINNSTTARDSFHRAVKGNVIGTVGSGSTTTSIVSSSLTPAGSVADKFKGRQIIFADDTTTANLRGQATDITANTNLAAPTFTVTALTTAPVSGDVFAIL